MNIPRKKINTPMEHRFGSNDTLVPTYNENIDHISQCYVTNWLARTEETKLDGRNEVLGSADISPAPLKLPSNKSSNKTQPAPQHLPIKVYSEYLFPLPPTGTPCSHDQTPRPRSPFPPPYSSLIPSTSTSSLKETLPRNNSNNFIKRPVHGVRRTQSSPDTQQISQYKPLPDKPLADINKGGPEGNKSWKRTIFRLTPAPKGVANGNIHSPRQTDLSVNVTHRQGSPPQAATSPKEPSLDEAENDKQQEQNRARENKRPNIKPHDAADMGRSKRGMPKDSLESKEGSCGDRERLTSEETLWLHRNYRGEATFLKAWGLHITRDADRERGREIMRELMAAESPKGKDRQVKGHLEKKHEQSGGIMITTPRDKGGLQAIEEERNIY